MFAGCTKPVDSTEASPFSVYRTKDNVRFTLGDKREDVEKMIDSYPERTIEFEEEVGEDEIFEQVIYDEVGVALDYDRAGNVLGLQARSSAWKIENGLKVTDSVEDVKRKYAEEYLYTYPKNDDLYYALDESGNLIEFSEDAPYILRFDIDQYAIYRIIIKKNVL